MIFQNTGIGRAAAFVQGGCHRAMVWRWLGVFLLLIALPVAGCSKKEKTMPLPASPPVKFTGPEFLYGSVGSLVTVRGTKPQLVSGYGLVVDLDETGSGSLPTNMRTEFIQQMRKNGVRNPSQLISRTDNAIVQVQGLVPPGAVEGDRFDLYVRAVPQTETTSLFGGKLWLTSLASGGANADMRFVKPAASGRGPIFIDPLDPDAKILDREKHYLNAVVLAGGVVTERRRIELVMNQPSWARASAVADRINERFPHQNASNFFNTAVAKSNQVIEINVPENFKGRPADLIHLILNLYLQRGEYFEVQRAESLAQVLQNEPKYAEEVVWTWHSLGQRVIPILRKYYRSESEMVRLKALEAGARLNDHIAAEGLKEFSMSPDPHVRLAASEILANLPDSLVAANQLYDLLNDDVREVRIAAYESLIGMNDPRIERFVFGNENEFKFILDLVPSNRPLVYVIQERFPRIALFNPGVRFPHGKIATLLDGRMTLMTSEASSEKLQVFFQPKGDPRGRKYEINRSVADIAAFIAHKTSVEYPDPGLDLTYSHVVDAMNDLVRQGHLSRDVDIAFERSQLAMEIAEYSREEFQGITGGTDQGMRPETEEGDTGESATDTGFEPLELDEEALRRATGGAVIPPSRPQGGLPNLGEQDGRFGPRPEIDAAPAQPRPELPPAEDFEDEEPAPPPARRGNDNGDLPILE